MMPKFIESFEIKFRAGNKVGGVKDFTCQFKDGCAALKFLRVLRECEYVCLFKKPARRYRYSVDEALYQFGGEPGTGRIFEPATMAITGTDVQLVPIHDCPACGKRFS